MKVIQRGLRFLIVITNTFWPFSALNRLPYVLAIKLFVHVLKKHPQINSIYLRHSLASTDWEPGLSDVDLTVIIDSHSKPEPEFTFLTQFWRKVRRLRQCLPMLSDVNVMTQDHFKSWMKFTILGHEARNWRLIYGKQTHRASYLGDSTELTRDSLNHAFTLYLEFFLPRFYNPASNGFIAKREQLRIANKIIRYGYRYQANPMDQPAYCHAAADKTMMLATILQGLECCIKGSALLPRNEVSQSVPAYAEGEFLDLTSDSSNEDLKALARIHELIASVYVSNDRYFLVLRDSLDDKHLRTAAKAISTAFEHPGKEPLILTQSMFAYLLLHADPAQYASLRWFRKLLLGDDILWQLEPPTRRVFATKSLANAMDVFPFQHHEALFNPPSSSSDSLHRDIVAMTWRVLCVKLCLQKGIVMAHKAEMLKECAEHFPTDYRHFLGLIEAGVDFQSPGVRLKCYRFMKQLANDLSDTLSTYCCHSLAKAGKIRSIDKVSV